MKDVRPLMLKDKRLYLKIKVFSIFKKVRYKTWRSTKKRDLGTFRNVFLGHQ